MNIRTLRNQIQELPDDVREEKIRKLLPLLTSMSLSTLNDFELDWDEARDRSEYTLCRNQIIHTAIAIETSAFGAQVRAQFGLGPLTLETELDQCQNVDLPGPTLDALARAAKTGSLKHVEGDR